MKGLNATFARMYKKNGKDVFVYTVKGSEADIKAYEESQGDNLRKDDDGNPLWFTVRYCGERTPLQVAASGNVYSDMSEFSKAASLAAQFGGNLGDQLAKVAAERLLGSPINNSPVNEVVQNTNELGGNMSRTNRTERTANDPSKADPKNIDKM